MHDWCMFVPRSMTLALLTDHDNDGSYCTLSASLSAECQAQELALIIIRIVKYNFTEWANHLDLAKPSLLSRPIETLRMSWLCSLGGQTLMI